METRIWAKGPTALFNLSVKTRLLSIQPFALGPVGQYVNLGLIPLDAAVTYKSHRHAAAFLCLQETPQGSISPS
jgi:hypothetical protein